MQSTESRIHRTPLTILMAVLMLAFALIPTHAAAGTIGPSLQQKLAGMSATDTTEVVITFRGDKVTADQLAALRTLGITRGFSFRELPVVGALATAAQIQALAARSDVRSVWANEPLEYHNAETKAITGVERMTTDPVLIARNGGFPYSGRGVGVAVNDSGIDALHRDHFLGQKVVENAQGATNLHAYSTLLPITYLEDQPNTDTLGHGTHVAGTVAGTGEMSGGKYAGAAPGAHIVGYGSGAALFVLDALGGLDYALVKQAEHRIRVINNSWGTSSSTFVVDDPINLATKRLYDRGIVVVFSAANAGPGDDTISQYSLAPWVICVANSYKDGTLNASSSRGFRGEKQTFSLDGQTWTLENRPTITAPGTFIISTRASTNYVTAVGAEAGPQEDVNRIEPAFLPFYSVLTGTSMSAPHVAGVVALMIEANPSISPAQVKDIIQKTATNLPGYEPFEVGAGMLNAYAAVDKAGRAAAAYGSTVNMTRSFNSSANVQSTESDFNISYNPVPELSPQQNRHTFTVPSGIMQLEAKAEVYGIEENTGNTVNVVLIAPDGTETSSGVSLLFPIDPVRAAVVPSPMPGEWTVELRGLRGDPANPTMGAAVPEEVEGVVRMHKLLGYSGLNDIANHPAKSSIQMAVAERLVDGDSSRNFRPDEKLSRYELADYLVMAAGIRQYRQTNGLPMFSDVSTSRSAFVEAAAVRGAALRDGKQQYRGVVLPTSATRFSPDSPVRRVDVAYGLVQSLGLEAEALALNGQQLTVQYGDQRIPIDDAGQIPADMRGYVQLALDLNIMNAYFTLTQGPTDLQPTLHATFKPNQQVTRAEYAVEIVRFSTMFLNGF